MKTKEISKAEQLYQIFFKKIKELIVIKDEDLAKEVANELVFEVKIRTDLK